MKEINIKNKGERITITIRDQNDATEIIIKLIEMIRENSDTKENEKNPLDNLLCTKDITIECDKCHYESKLTEKSLLINITHRNKKLMEDLNNQRRLGDVLTEYQCTRCKDTYHTKHKKTISTMANDYLIFQFNPQLSKDDKANSTYLPLTIPIDQRVITTSDLKPGFSAILELVCTVDRKAYSNSSGHFYNRFFIKKDKNIGR